MCHWLSYRRGKKRRGHGKEEKQGTDKVGCTFIFKKKYLHSLYDGSKLAIDFEVKVVEGRRSTMVNLSTCLIMASSAFKCASIWAAYASASNLRMLDGTSSLDASASPSSEELLWFWDGKNPRRQIKIGVGGKERCQCLQWQHRATARDTATKGSRDSNMYGGGGGDGVCENWDGEFP